MHLCVSSSFEHAGQEDTKSEPLPLAEVLLKCKQEDGLEKEDKLLFIDWHDESIKCGLFKGSTEP